MIFVAGFSHDKYNGDMPYNEDKIRHFSELCAEYLREESRLRFFNPDIVSLNTNQHKVHQDKLKLPTQNEYVRAIYQELAQAYNNLIRKPLQTNH